MTVRLKNPKQWGLLASRASINDMAVKAEGFFPQGSVLPGFELPRPPTISARRGGAHKFVGSDPGRDKSSLTPQFQRSYLIQTRAAASWYLQGDSAGQGDLFRLSYQKRCSLFSKRTQI